MVAQEDSAGRVVVLPWSRTGSPSLRLAAALFALVLFAFALRQGQFQPVHRVLVALGGLATAYHLAAHWLNATRLSLRRERLVIEHGPIPLRRRQSLPLDQLERVVCDRHARRIELRTRIGEQLVVLEGLQPSLLDEAERALVDRLGLGAPRGDAEEDHG